MPSSNGPARTQQAPVVAPIRPSLRFRVLQRDGFRCRYCGISADDGAVLHVDHVHPRALGGANTMDNLVTACLPCNLGKGKRVLGPPRSPRQIRGTRRRYVSTPPPLIRYEWGAHCSTPLKVAVVGHQIGLTSYRSAWLYCDRIVRHSDTAEIPPHRITDAAWFELVRTYSAEAMERAA